jgi:hypothetical protein
MKRCNKCGCDKDESEFYVDSRSKKTPKGFETLTENLLKPT